MVLADRCQLRLWIMIAIGTGANDPDPDPAGRSGASPVRTVPPHRGRRLAQRAGHGAPARRDLGCLIAVTHLLHPSHPRGPAESTDAHYSYTYPV